MMLCSLGIFSPLQIGIAILNAQIHIDGVTTVADRTPDVRRVVRAGVAILVMALLKDVVARLDTSLVKFSCEFEQTRGYSEQDDMAGGSLCVRRSGVCLRPCEHVVPSDMCATVGSLASSPCYSR
ncbi:hypothetical protein KXD40_001581 [Peronospora effusa]|nr:hypothetical protein KXD40_001581 [Peronospora effusa]